MRELRRPAKSFCVAKLSVAGEPEPLEGVFKQVSTMAMAMVIAMAMTMATIL